MNSILAWFITFNFINISWVFFRAKEWDDAIKVLRGMFGFDGVMLPEKYASKLSFLHDIGVQFGQVTQDIGNGGSKTLNCILISFFILLILKNTSQILQTTRLNLKTSIFAGILFMYAVFQLTKFSEFLYFNF
jgi:D-alanyl-lipoteichoic acid acyltransferase DltB (MBOAT superfamily)